MKLHICRTAVCALALTAALLSLTGCQQLPGLMIPPDSSQPAASQPTEQTEGASGPLAPPRWLPGEIFDLTIEGSTLKFRIVDQEAKDLYVIYGQPAPTGALVVPTSVTKDGITFTVSLVYEAAFMGREDLTSVTIQDSPGEVTTIGGATFKDCTGLEKVTLSNQVTAIRPYAFVSCTNLKSIYIPTSVTHLEENPFDGADQLTIYYQGSQEDWEKIHGYESVTRPVRFLAKPEDMP